MVLGYVVRKEFQRNKAAGRYERGNLRRDSQKGQIFVNRLYCSGGLSHLWTHDKGRGPMLFGCQSFSGTMFLSPWQKVAMR
jgi:hypothetical protein